MRRAPSVLNLGKDFDISRDGTRWSPITQSVEVRTDILEDRRPFQQSQSWGEE